MADIGAANWTEIDSANTSAPPNGWPSGTTLPSQVEPGLRAMMGAVRRWWDRSNATLTSGGAANVQTLTYAVAPSAYVQGEVYRFIAGFTNTGATTLNVNALGAKAVQANGAALVGGEIVAGRVVVVTYDGTQFQIQSATPVGTAGGDLGSTYPNPTVVATHLSAPLPVAQGGTAGATAAAAFANIAVAASSIANPGYIKFANGLVDQWGKATILAGNTSVAVTFPLAFPTAAFAVTIGGAVVGGSSPSIPGVSTASLTTTGVTLTLNLAAASNVDIYWRAIGN